MRQLYELIGRENFAKTMKAYFEMYKYDNATLDDFLRVMDRVVAHEMLGGKETTANVSKDQEYLNLFKFRDDWILTAGLNEVQCQWNAGEQTFCLNQGVALPAHAKLRYHKMKVGFFGANGKLLEEQEIILQNQPETVVESTAVGVQAVVPNIGDWTFIKIVLDAASLEYMKKNISLIEDELTRNLVWRSLFDMVRDCRILKSTDLLDLLITHIPQEKSNYVKGNLFSFLGTTLENYCPSDLYPHFKDLAFSMVYTTISSSKITSPDELKLLASCLLKFAWSDNSLKILQAWLQNTDPNLTALKPTLQEKYTILSYLYARPSITTPEFLAEFKENLIKEDKTDMKIEFLHKIESLTANDEKR